MSIEPVAAKPRRKAPGKPSEPSDARKVKTTVHLSGEASRRLSVHATMFGMDRSALVEKLINDSLRRFVVSDRERSSGAGEGRGEGPEIA